jgi:putative component of membrane protein insertase Oxa1/YidC/SpoIIIJ protein YidD
VRLAVRFYRRFLTGFTPACGLSPSCSAYAVDHGVWASWVRMRAAEGVRCGDKHMRGST